MLKGEVNETGDVIRWLLLESDAVCGSAFEVFDYPSGSFYVLMGWIGLILCKEVCDCGDVRTGALAEPLETAHKLLHLKNC